MNPRHQRPPMRHQRPPMHRQRPPMRRQCGAALLMAMLTVALVAVLSSAALWRHWRGVEVEAAERGRVQSAWLLTGALDWSRLVLTGDLVEDERNRRSQGLQPADHLGEPWAVPLAEARLSTFLAMDEGGGAASRDAFLSGEITDLQARLNIMNLIAASPADRLAAVERFSRLFEQLGISRAELGSLQRALDRADRALKAGGAHGQGAGGADAGDAPLMPRRFEQLAWLGVSPATLRALRPHASLLPLPAAGGTTRVNLNTASALVIHAALPGVDMAGAQRIVQLRDSAPWRSVADARQKAALPDAANTDWAGVSSEHFEVRGRLRLDNVALQELAVVQRLRNSRSVRTLWRERTAITDAP